MIASLKICAAVHGTVDDNIAVNGAGDGVDGAQDGETENQRSSAIQVSHFLEGPGCSLYRRLSARHVCTGIYTSSSQRFPINVESLPDESASTKFSRIKP